MKDFKLDKNGVLFTKVSNFRIEHTPHPVFGEMVTIVRGPSFGSHLFGKKYVNIEKALHQINIVCGEKLIGKGLNQAVAEMADLGLIPASEFTEAQGNIIVEPHYSITNVEL